MNKTLNQRIYETPGDVKKALYDSGYEAGKTSAIEQLFADLEEFHAGGNYREFYILTEESVNHLKKKYGVQ